MTIVVSAVSPALEYDTGGRDQDCRVDIISAFVDGSECDSKWMSTTVSTMF